MTLKSAIIYDRSFDYAPPSADWVEVIHRDDHILVINKPAGLLSVPGKADHMSDCVARYMAQRFDGALIVHRLDMATSGIMVLAMNAAAQRHLGLQFERRHTEKSYIADVAGAPQRDRGTIDKPLRCDWPNRPRQIVDFDQGKNAVTHWEVMARHDGYSRLRLTPVTGRSHQLRVHMLDLGHPIIGDRLYAPDEVFTMGSRLHLHAEKLSLFHPDGGARVEFVSEPEF